jgi:hypothetical protein
VVSSRSGERSSFFGLFFVHQAINGEHAATEIFNLRLVGCTLGADVVAIPFFRQQLLVNFIFPTDFWCVPCRDKVSSVRFSWLLSVRFEFMYPLRRAVGNVFRMSIPDQREDGRA